MITRIHVASFIAFTILVWLIALWVQGLPVLSVEFVRPFSIVVGTAMVAVTLFSKYAWAWRIFKGWYIERPDLRGTWQVELKSTWIDPSTGETVAPIEGYAAVRQSLYKLQLRLMTRESRSKLIAHSIDKDEDGVFRLAGIYRNVPQIELQGVRSEIHHGSFLLEIHGNSAESMDGHYWTDRGTRGSMRLFGRRGAVCETFESARREFSGDAEAPP